MRSQNYQTYEAVSPSNIRTRQIRTWILIAVLTAGFFWKITFTKQFSVLLQWESANQAYAWYHVAAQSVKSGTLPVWDRYTFSGHPFVGEMQTGLFDPLKLLLYFAPFDARGLFSERVYNYSYVLSHFLAAVFMYSLAISLDIEVAGALVAAIAFSFGGFVGKLVWPNMLNASIWLPLLLLLLIRAGDAKVWSRRLAFGGLAGMILGLTILAGSPHVAIMDGFVVATFLAYVAYRSHVAQSNTSAVAGFATILLIVGIFSLAFSAIQLFPSMEYGLNSVRWIDSGEPIAAFDKIPYFRLSETARQIPRSFVGFLFGGAFIGDAEISPYIGLLPFILAIVGVWRRSDKWLVRYLAILAIGSYLYSLGSFSFIHGLLYLLPALDKAREAGRFIYLTHFALSLLAGFGVQVILSRSIPDRQAVSKMLRILSWACAVTVIALGFPALYGVPAVNEWHYFSALLLIAATGSIAYASEDRRFSMVVVVLVILFDLHAFNWNILNKGLEARQDHDYLAQLRDTKPIAEFLRSQGSLFRVRVDGEFPPNIGDLFGIDTVGGNGVSMLKSYFLLRQTQRQFPLLNVRYAISQADDPAKTAVFTSGKWKVYEQPDYLPRAWVVYRTVTGNGDNDVREILDSPGFDPRNTALLEGPAPQLAVTPSRPATVDFKSYSLHSAELAVESEAPGLLVFSEVNYPGWHATVNGTNAQVLTVDAALRGVTIPSGHSTVRFYYRPATLILGAITTFVTLIVIGLLLLYANQFIGGRR